MDTISEARAIQKEIQEYKREIILLERELKKDLFEEAFQSKQNLQEKLRQEMVSLNQELQQLKQESSKIKQSQEELEHQEIYNLHQQIEQIRKENIHLIAQEEQLKKSDQLLDINQQNYIYGLYQRRLGPTERENADLAKKIKKCEEDIEKLKIKCEKVKTRYPSSYVEKLRVSQERFSEVSAEEGKIRQQVALLESEIRELQEIPKQNPQELMSKIYEVTTAIEKDRQRANFLEKKIKEKQQELRVAKLTIPKANGSHGLYKEIELLGCILVDKIGELGDVTNQIEDLREKLDKLQT
jgi:DNA repair exonuclease SbcCD ATPase subunit